MQSFSEQRSKRATAHTCTVIFWCLHKTFSLTHREIPARRNDTTCWPEQAKLRVNRTKCCSGKWSSQAKAADLSAQAHTQLGMGVKQLKYETQVLAIYQLWVTFTFKFSPHVLDTTEIMEWLGMERILKLILLYPLPWAGTSSTRPRCFKSPVQPSLSHFERWSSNSFYGHPVPGPRHSPMEVLLIIPITLPSDSGKPLALVQSPSPAPLEPAEVLKDCSKITLDASLPQANNPNSHSLLFFPLMNNILLLENYQTKLKRFSFFFFNKIFTFSLWCPINKVSNNVNPF